MYPDEDNIFRIRSEEEFNNAALGIFRFQKTHCKVYGDFIRALKTPEGISHYSEIPFLPVEFFKSHKIVSGIEDAGLIFESSGTTGTDTARHYVAKASLYEKSFVSCFEKFYGSPSGYVILALLPSYLERGNSSLVYMADKLIRLSGKPESGFFLDDFKRLKDILLDLKDRNQKTLLLGVTYALLDFADQSGFEFPGLTIMETGGMKGRRKELIRSEVHENLRKVFGVSSVHSEYGMTELLSQAYSEHEGIFHSLPWMKVLIRDMNDPLSLVKNGITGGINLIDLANVYSCSFLSTSDLGKRFPDGSFEVLGRFDASDVRGCSLLV